MEKYGCTTPFSTFQENICRENITGKQALEHFEDLSDERKYIKECLNPCEHMKLSATYLAARGNRNDFSMNFYQYIKVAEASYSYTELELVAEIGGYVGLFLGVSVIDINQIFSKLLNYMKIWINSVSFLFIKGQQKMNKKTPIF